MFSPWVRMGCPFLAVAMASVSLALGLMVLGVWFINEWRISDGGDVIFEEDDE